MSHYCRNAASAILFAVSIMLACSQASFGASAPLECVCDFCGDVIRQAGRTTAPYSPSLDPKAISVSSSDQLIQAITEAKSGTTIIVERGEYNTGRLKIGVPIHIVAKYHWAAVFKEGSLLELEGSGSSIQGIRFEGGAPVSPTNSRDHSLYVRADDVTIEDNQFWNSGVHSNIPDKTGITIEVIGSKRTIIQNNEFSHSHGVAIKTDDTTRDISILRNDFFDSPEYGGSGEIAHLGDALATQEGVSPVNDDIRAIVSFNHIRAWQLEAELISVKSNFNTISNNFVENSGESSFVIRMGNNNNVTGNVMTVNTIIPTRISGSNNVFSGNYFAGNGSLTFLHNKTYYRKSAKNLIYAYLPANNNILRNNIFVGYEHVFGLRDQEHVVRDAPMGNLFEQNTIYAPLPNDLSNEFIDTSSMKFNRNKVESLDLANCP